MNNKKQHGIIIAATFMSSLFLNCSIANAELIQNTLSVGYAQSHAKGEDSEKPKGLNLKYRNEINGNWGVIGSLSYTKYNEDINGTQGNTHDMFGSVKLNYYSLAAGPSYRINDYFSIYALIGGAYGKARVDFVDFGSSTQNKSSLVYGSGIQYNPIKNMAVDISYEHSKFGDLDLGTLVAGVGYRF